MSESNPSGLQVLPFAKEQLEFIADFDCGNEPWEVELAEWLQRDALRAMKRGTDVWLFVAATGDVVGYASLGVTKWSWPEPSSDKVPIQIIPALAIRKVYWGKPEGPREARYSSLILDHVLAEATSRSDLSPLLGLFVHPNNQRAIRVYERAGFASYLHTYTDPATQTIYRSMIYELRPQVHDRLAPAPDQER